MNRPSLSLKYRVRYENLGQTFDRRTQKDIESDLADSPIQRLVAETLARHWGKKPSKKLSLFWR